MVRLAILATVVTLLVVYVTATPPAPVRPDNAKPVETHSSFHVAPAAEDSRVDNTYELKDSSGRLIGTWFDDGGQLFSSPETAGVYSLSVTTHRYLYDPKLDLGAFAGVGISGDSDRFQPGIRVSPVRLAWGTTALDAVATANGAGIGASIYPPPRYFGRWWNHIGVGGWYIVPFDGSDPGVTVGLSFSTRH
jgi:hypothetical protein